MKNRVVGKLELKHCGKIKQKKNKRSASLGPGQPNEPSLMTMK
jgi:hypothetical protein